ncbi:hypothetical protein [Methylomonas koyamae]|uniref:hypothetical protein n=1 Tax=Methylomonas koyamae TaxID=702114 RepID=UPI002110863C|nr:hypothetical protein [Methylomonas koyamae]
MQFGDAAADFGGDADDVGTHHRIVGARMPVIDAPDHAAGDNRAQYDQNAEDAADQNPALRKIGILRSFHRNPNESKTTTKC